MPNLLNILYDTYVESTPPAIIPSISDAKERLSKNTAALDADLDNQQSILLLDIIDDKDLICCIKSEYNFIEGFKYGVKMISAVFFEDMDL